MLDNNKENEFSRGYNEGYKDGYMRGIDDGLTQTIEQVFELREYLIKKTYQIIDIDTLRAYKVVLLKLDDIFGINDDY